MPRSTGFSQRPNIFAFGIAAAAEKLAEFPPAQQHRPAALLAGLVDFFFGLAIWISPLSLRLKFLVFLHSGYCGQARNSPLRPHLITIMAPHLSQSMSVGTSWRLTSRISFVGFFEVARERRVKALHRLGPFFFAVFDLVQLIFHAGSELDVQDIGKALHQKIGDEKTQDPSAPSDRLSFWMTYSRSRIFEMIAA